MVPAYRSWLRPSPPPGGPGLAGAAEPPVVREPQAGYLPLFDALPHDG